MRILLGLLFISLLYGFDTNPVNVPISDVSPKFINFPAGNLKVGQSGIIFTHKEGYNVIIANAIITDIKGETAYATYTPFNGIEQKYLPTPIAKPLKGDIASFSRFYNKAIAIAPNQDGYNKILSLQNQVHFVHIDLFAAFLAKDGVHDPKPKHFKAFCSTYSVGLVYIMATNGINVLDCQSFALLEEIPLQVDITQTQAPFFSRISEVSTGSLVSKLRVKKTRQYFNYYDGLLSESSKALHLIHKE